MIWSFSFTSDNPICPNQGEPNRSSIPRGPATPKFSMFQNLGKGNTPVQLIFQTDIHAELLVIATTENIVMFPSQY